MAVNSRYLAYVLEQLGGVAALHSRRMFGGVGVYGGDLFFGLIDDDVLFLRADDSNRPDFLARGMPPFQPFKDKPEYSMSYYQVPADVLEDAEQLAAWARKSIAVAANSKDLRAKKSRSKKSRAEKSRAIRRGRAPADRRGRATTEAASKPVGRPASPKRPPRR